MATPVRSAAASLLDDVAQGSSLNHVYNRAERQVAESEQPFLRELVYGSLRLWPLYKGVTRQLLERPLKPKDSVLEALLIMAMYELDECATPDYASVSGAVDCCEQLGRPWASRLINGCLRRYQRDKEALMHALGESERAALPGWLHKLLSKALPDQLSQLADASRHRPPFTLRVNPERVSTDEYQALLREEGIEASAAGACGLTLVQPMPVSKLPHFQDGFVSVQDASAQLAALLLSPEPGMSVLDACAAPGGKACHLAELGAQVTASDVSEARLIKVHENAERLDLAVTTVLSDGRNLQEVLALASFDAVLLDVPCSATGVMRRNPDVKLIRRKSDIGQFATLQSELLQSVWPLLKPGGRLLYATCSVLPQENDAVVGAFLDAEDTARLLPLPIEIGETMTYGQQVIPSELNGDGLYYSLLEKAIP
jgi:16S rRNA (cytosine967-C5)-methyltransferase